MYAHLWLKPTGSHPLCVFIERHSGKSMKKLTETEVHKAKPTPGQENKNPSSLRVQESTKHQKLVIIQRLYQCFFASSVCLLIIICTLHNCYINTVNLSVCEVWSPVFKILKWMSVHEVVPEIHTSAIQRWMENHVCLDGRKKCQTKAITYSFFVVKGVKYGKTLV